MSFIKFSSICIGYLLYICFDCVECSGIGSLVGKPLTGIRRIGDGVVGNLSSCFENKLCHLNTVRNQFLKIVPNFRHFFLRNLDIFLVENTNIFRNFFFVMKKKRNLKRVFSCI